MTDNFAPSPSVDSHTTPMEIQIPLIQSSLSPEHSINNNAPLSGTSNISKEDPLLPGNSKKSKILKASNKLFDVSQIKTLEFYQALLSEFLGTLILTLICTSTGLPITSKPVPDINGALASGLIVATIIVGFGHTSGAHVNPAVTVTFLVSSEIDYFRALCYIGVQLLGAFSASSLLRFLTPLNAREHLGMTMITDGVSLTQAFIVEFVITFLLCYTVHAICDKRRDDIGGSKALAAGFIVTVGCLFGGPYTGASMNPARSFGPAAVMNIWKDYWIYWLGPLAGSITASLIYTRILKKKPPTITVHNESTPLIHRSNI
jgi:MIP family channel proteins